METIAWLGFSQALFAAIIMMAKKNRSVPDKLLSAWLCLLSIAFLTCAIDYAIFGYPLLSSSFLLFNPAFYLYVKSLIKSDFRLKWIQLLHLVPFVFFETFAYILHEPYVMSGFLAFDSTFLFRYFFSIASILSWIAYNAATASIIFKHRKRILDEYSNIESNKKVTWLIFIVIFYNAFCFASVIIGAFSVFSDMAFPLTPVYNYSTLLLMVYILGFYGLKQEIIYTEITNEDKLHERYTKSQLSTERKEIINQQIIEYFRKHQPYLNPNLSMDILSDSLKIPKHQLTEVLNVSIGKNFFQFVNEYRVEEVKKRLKKPKQNFSIEAIGYDCGFSSKSSFFTVFKKITGKTPSQFKELES
jgi:AraC-like DNA-binding protein